MKDYDHGEIEKKWAERWKKLKLYQPELKKAKKPFYNLMMFPYPSAEGLHVGNMYAFTGADIYGRYQRMQGYDVFEPIGLDGFGIHSENYAIKIGKHPAEQARVSQERFYKQLSEIGNGFAWDNTLETYDPGYYKWTQWLFIQMFKRGLAVRKKSWVNWCPQCKTVLADEQVEGGVCERCKSETVRKENKQWFFRITEYADRLLANIDGLDPTSAGRDARARRAQDDASDLISVSDASREKAVVFGPVNDDYDPRRDGLRWPEKIKTAQRQWIGRKKGINIKYPILNSQFSIECFTTRPDTNFGATFVVLAPEYGLVEKILKGKIKLPDKKVKEIKKYVETSLRKTEQQRKEEERKKTGVFTGIYAINQLNNYKMPIWISDFVLMDVGTGAVVGVPGHDKRDFEFAKKFGIEVKRVVATAEGDVSEIKKIDQVLEEDGFIVDSEFLNGMQVEDAKKKIMDHFEKKGWGKRTYSYHLRDWLISRQRYWGPPIPMLFCKSCASKKISWFTEHGPSAVASGTPTRRAQDDSADFGSVSALSKEDKAWHYGWWPVEEKDLSVELPEISEWEPAGDGKSPLEKAERDWLFSKCPHCGGRARRETDVSDTFLDSSWYFLAYPNLGTDEWKGIKAPLNRRLTKKWLPVDAYIGGAEHAVLHLLYSRFVCMAMNDWGYVEFEEPFPFLYSHGLIIKEGAKMSKSRGNVVVPDDYLNKFGADSLRAYLMFLGPYNQGGDFKDSGINGMRKFLVRIWRLYRQKQGKIGRRSDKVLASRLHRTIKKVGSEIAKFKYNTAIAELMSFVKAWEEEEALSRKDAGDFLKIIAPIAPYLAEELWQELAKDEMSRESDEKKKGKSIRFRSIHRESWPEFDKKLIEKKKVEIIVQVNGRLRDKVVISSNKARKKTTVVGLAKNLPGVKRYLNDKPPKKTIWVPGKLVNFVV